MTVYALITVHRPLTRGLVLSPTVSVSGLSPTPTAPDAVSPRHGERSGQPSLIHIHSSRTYRVGWSTAKANGRERISLAHREFTRRVPTWRLGRVCLRVELKVPCPGDYLGVRGGSQYPFTPVDGDVDRPAETNMAMAATADEALEAAHQAWIKEHDSRVVSGGVY